MSSFMCGQTDYLSVTSSSVSTIVRHPNYPFDYLPDTDCTYTFRKNQALSPIYFLVLKFLTSNYEIHGGLPDCDRDYLEITIGETSEKSFRFCGNDIPFTIYSTEIIKYRIFGHPDSDGGSFTAKVTVRSANLGTGCLNKIPSGNGKTGVVTSPQYPHGYGNGTCDIRLYVGSNNVIDLYFVEVDLANDVSKNDCNNVDNPQDYIEIRGASKASTTFLQATRIKSRLCGSSSEITRYVGLRYDYVYIRFSSSHDTYDANGYTSSRGMNVGYAIYAGKSEKENEPSHSNTILWICIIASVVLVVIIIWVILYKALNSKKAKKKAKVRPANAPDALLTTMDTTHSKQLHSPPPIAPPYVPDYNPAELFAAKPVVDLNSDIPQSGDLSGALFPDSKQDFGLTGLSPGYTPSRHENTAGQVA